ncbi:hypothetical protein CHH28_04075 [Bacterioplanes sanyensis]|uniref:NAD(P)-binding domain-containing protein n=1 Tax=Bacterioplanes sanyensis TaxID=1249553 RepID=A0A222FH06_9GAMM|nr:NAD(P)H-binding protein [Bacterioplanes sanyensis]ASP37902.1 hypothetical protein CHH28_04075 [Bacterioplanes sanyensis]
MINTVAVIGGTGMLGKPVSEQFAKAGYRVVVISRHAQASAAHFSDELSLVFRDVDIFSHQQLQEALADVDAIHINLSGNSPQTYHRHHLQGTAAVLQAKSAQTQLISMISTATAYPQNDFRMDTKAKLEAEELLKQSGVNYMSYLPSWFFETLELLQQDNTVTTMGEASQPLSWLSANDFAKAVVQSYQQAALYNRRLTLLGPEAFSIIEAADRYASTMGYQRAHMSNEEALNYAQEVQDDTLLDAIDLLTYTEKVGEHPEPQTLDHPLVMTETLDEWSVGK